MADQEKEILEEEMEQVDFLKQMKCDSIQGYYYSRPLPKEEFEKLLLTA